MRYLTLLTCLSTVSLVAACSPVDAIAPASNAANVQDQAIHERTSQDAMETGHTLSWKSSGTNNYGTITPDKPYRNENGSYCRDFTQTITINVTPHTGTGTACRGGNGIWKIIG